MQGQHGLLLQRMQAHGAVALFSGLAAYSAWVIPSPVSWALVSVWMWMLYGSLRQWHLTNWDKRQLLWGIGSAVALLAFFSSDPDFQVGVCRAASVRMRPCKKHHELYKSLVTLQGWGDVYFFCGAKMQYCTCRFQWNLAGWHKAAVLWSFVLSAALGAQRLAIQLGLNGLLPGRCRGRVCSGQLRQQVVMLHAALCCLRRAGGHDAVACTAASHTLWAACYLCAATSSGRALTGWPLNQLLHRQPPAAQSPKKYQTTTKQ